ncbi:MAG: hypothetical protein B7Z55_15255 [Planctomycetales bacterium 12-60-4]|nr:MAG: hypothetical protein B7Z55_15255 [Planctomycetales bacterium 12-60-4]
MLIATVLTLAGWIGSPNVVQAAVAGDSYLTIVRNLSGGSVQMLLNFDGGSNTVTFVTRNGALGSGIYSESTAGLTTQVTTVFVPNPTLTSFQAVNFTFAGSERLLGVGFGNSGRIVVLYGESR